MSSTALQDTSFSDSVANLVREGSLGSTVMTLQPQTRLYNRGDRDDHVFLVHSGRVKTFTVAFNGKDCLLSLHGPGDVFGELCLVLRGRTETAAAMTTTTVRRMGARDLVRALGTRGLLEDFVRHEAMRVAEQQELITSFVTMNSERRLAARILQLARQIGERQPRGLSIEDRITQEELAAMVGTTRSRVGLFLKRFVDAGLVRRTGGECFLIVDEERLTEYLNSGLASAGTSFASAETSFASAETSFV